MDQKQPVGKFFLKLRRKTGIQMHMLPVRSGNQPEQPIT